MRPGTTRSRAARRRHTVRPGAVLHGRRRQHAHRAGRCAVGARRPRCRPRRLSVRSGQPQGELSDTRARSPTTMAIEVPLKAGDVVVFTEALTHGTASVAGPPPTAHAAVQVLPRQLGLVARGMARRTGRSVHAAATAAAATTVGRQPPAAAVITHLFIYGTLRPGQQRWPHLAPFVADQGHDDVGARGSLRHGQRLPGGALRSAGPDPRHASTRCASIGSTSAYRSSTRSKVPWSTSSDG